MFLPALCRKMGVPYCIVKNKSRLEIHDLLRWNARCQISWLDRTAGPLSCPSVRAPGYSTLSGRFTLPLDRLGYLKLAKHCQTYVQSLNGHNMNAFHMFNVNFLGLAECADARQPPALPSPTLSPTTDPPSPSWSSPSRPTTTSVARRSRGKNFKSPKIVVPKGN